MTKKIIQNVDEWQCVTCDKNKPGEESKTYTRKEIIEHLSSIHGLSGKTRGSRQLLMHLDCSDHWQSTYQWNIGDVVLANNIIQARLKNDPMRSEEG